MKLKEGVIVTAIRTELLLALIIAEKVWLDCGKELVITSLNDGQHSNISLHYAGQAADLCTRYFAVPKTVGQNLSDALGNNPDYDVVVEKDHIHLEWQPKYRGG